MFIIFGKFTDGFVDAGKFGICDNSTDHFNEKVCDLTMMTMDNGLFQSIKRGVRLVFHGSKL